MVNAIETTEIDLLLEGIFRVYGYDFRDYAKASITRRVKHHMQKESIATITALQDRVLHSADAMTALLMDLSVHVTAMFRDPAFYLAFRAKVVPVLRTYPFVRLWLAGCSTGEEVYSMAIVLKEGGLHEKSRIYATDMNEDVLARAKAGIFPLKAMREYTANYIAGGGEASFSEYYTSAHDNVIISPALRSNVVFAQHNLAADSTFNEFHLILCRNVMIYFNKALMSRVHTLFYDSLMRLGFLALGAKESIKFSPHEDCYKDIDKNGKIYRKVK